MNSVYTFPRGCQALLYSGSLCGIMPLISKTERIKNVTKTILFDLDGTLTDSGAGIMNCAVEALNHFGLPVPDVSILRTIVGPPLDDSLIRLGLDPKDVDEGITVFRKRYTAVGKFENVPYPGIHSLLEKLKAQGHTLYVATSKPEIMAVEIMEHFDLAKYFDSICGATLDKSRASKSAVIAYLMEKNGRADNMVMVGDTAYDVLGAAEHRIPTIGVTWGYGEEADMVNAGAAAIAHSMDELFTLLNP